MTQPIPMSKKLGYFKVGDRVKINTYRDPEGEHVVPYLTADKPILSGERRPAPKFVNATGTIIKIDDRASLLKNGLYGFIRVKFDGYQFGFKTCEFPLYDDDLVVKTTSLGNKIYGAYLIDKI